MQTTTVTDVFAQAGYSVTTKLVDRVDNQGEPCEVCQTEGRFIDATVYGVELGEFANLFIARDCCVFCVPNVIKTLDATADVTVELGDSLDDGDNGLMAHPDDDRPHPDAA